MPLKEMCKIVQVDQQQSHTENIETTVSIISEELCPVVNNLEESYPKITTTLKNQDNSHVPPASNFRRQRKTKFGTLHSGFISINNKEVHDLEHAKELTRAKEYIKKLKKKLDTSQQKYIRLQEKATSLAFFVKQLRGEDLLPEDAELSEK